MVLYGRPGVCTSEDVGEIERVCVEGKDSEHVVMDQTVVPRWTGSVVSVVVAFHVWVACEPTGVVVRTLSTTEW